MKGTYEKITSEKRYRILGWCAILVLLVSSCAFFVGTTGKAVAETSGDYEYRLINDSTEVEITKYRGAGGNVEIPAVIDGKPVTAIGDNAFIFCSSMVHLTIPDSVRSIGNRSFFDCTSLTYLAIPDGVTTIGVSMFHGCHSLTSVTIPGSVTTIGYWAFLYCDSLTSVTIPGSVTSIDWGAFSDCTSLTQMHFEGNAPYCGDGWISGHNDSLVIYFFNGSTGFTTPTWYDVPTVCLPVPAAPWKFEPFLVLGVIGGIAAGLIIATVIMRKRTKPP